MDSFFCAVIQNKNVYLTRASSGSALGSTPNSKSLAPIMVPPSPAKMGEDRRASARLGPGGTVTRWEPVPSFPFRVFTNAVSFSVFTSWSDWLKIKKVKNRSKEIGKILKWSKERFQVGYLFSEIYHIYIDLFFFQPLCQLYQLERIWAKKMVQTCIAQNITID